MKKINDEKFIEKARLKHGNKYEYSKNQYINCKIKTIITCPIHGDFPQTPSDHLSGCGCPRCGKEKIIAASKYDQETFISKARKVHGDKYDYSNTNYISSKFNVSINCRIHGDFFQRPNAHVSSGQGCPKCGAIKVGSYSQSNKEDFVLKAKQVHGDKYNYDEVIYIRSHLKVKIGCPEHGCFEQTPNNHLSKKAGCPVCNSSKGELRISEILIKHKIKFVREYRIPNINVRFEYDFYLPDYNLLIEFQGIQHYESIEYFGGEENLRYVKRNDIFKKALAREVKIKLIEFSYVQLKHLTEKEFEKMVLRHVMFGLPSMAEMDEYID